MSCIRVSHLGVLLAVTGVGCAAPPHVALSAAAKTGVSDDSPICRAVVGRFVGVPGRDSSSAPQAQALAGRWWVRDCSATRVANGVRVRLAGPGWYFVDERGEDFAVRQQVPFTLAVELEGLPTLAVTRGVAAFGFEPRVPPKVDLHLESALSVRATSAWGSLLGWVPLVSVRDIAAERLSSAAVAALQVELRGGATATYDLKSGQSDVALGQLQPGHVPARAFPDGIRWVVNDRLLLPPSATQVVGPINPGRTRLDAQIERGEGLAYRTVCERDMPASYPAIASGHLEALPTRASVELGTFVGLGQHSATLSVERCKFFVVLSTLRDSTTVVSLRVRG